MSSAGELLFDRTRIERRVQLLRTLARDLARTRQNLRDALGADPPPSRRARRSRGRARRPGRAAVADHRGAARRDRGAAPHDRRAPARAHADPHGERAQNLMTHAARTLRALRRATGVHVELRTLGEDTEFDKAVAEQLVDPITQLLRNAVAHGVEPPDERVARGKPAAATITIRARQDGNLLVLEVSDDGRGIDTAALRDRLVATGRWSDGARAARDRRRRPGRAARHRRVGARRRRRARRPRHRPRPRARDGRAARRRGAGHARRRAAARRSALRLPLSTVARAGDAVQGRRPGLRDPRTCTSSTPRSSTPGADARACATSSCRCCGSRRSSAHGPTSERRPAVVVVAFAGKSLVVHRRQDRRPARDHHQAARPAARAAHAVRRPRRSAARARSS